MIQRSKETEVRKIFVANVAMCFDLSFDFAHLLLPSVKDTASSSNYSEEELALPCLLHIVWS